MALHTYARRRYSPFASTVQVVEEDLLKAESYDGVNWHISVLVEDIENSWMGISSQDTAPTRYLPFGVWSQREGLARFRSSYHLYNLDVESVVRPLLERLPHLPLPFDFNDPYENWLLDANKQPLALLCCKTGTEALIDPPPIWRSHDQEATPANDIPQKLEREINHLTGNRPITCWFFRDTSAGDAGELHPFATRLDIPAQAIPPLPLNPHSLPADLNPLVERYYEQLAPHLLTLPKIPDPVLAQWEHYAWKQAKDVERLHRLYPRVINQAGLKAARVEALMRSKDERGDATET